MAQQENEYDAADLADMSDDDLAVLFNPDRVSVISMPNGNTIAFAVRRLTLAEIVGASSILRAFSEALAKHTNIGTAISSVVDEKSDEVIDMMAAACGTTPKVLRVMPGAAFVDLVLAFINENQDFFNRVRDGRAALSDEPATSPTPASPASLLDGAESFNDSSQTAIS